MTAPTITYGHGFLNDTWTNLSDDYTLTVSGSTATASLSFERDLEIAVSAYVGTPYLTNDDALGLSTATYTTFICRYETTVSAKIEAVFSDASTQVLVNATTATNGFTVATAILTTGKTLNYLKIYGPSNTGTTIYDFILIVKGTFTFPQYSRLTWLMRNRYNNTEVPGRIGRRKSWLGADEIVVSISGDTDTQRDGWKRPVGTTSKTDTLPAEVLNEIHHNAATEPYQWFTSDRGSFKTVMEDLQFVEDTEQTYIFSFNTTLSEYGDSNLTKYSLKERFKL